MAGFVAGHSIVLHGTVLRFRGQWDSTWNPGVRGSSACDPCRAKSVLVTYRKSSRTHCNRIEMSDGDALFDELLPQTSRRDDPLRFTTRPLDYYKVRPVGVTEDATTAFVARAGVGISPTGGVAGSFDAFPLPTLVEGGSQKRRDTRLFAEAVSLGHANEETLGTASTDGTRRRLPSVDIALFTAGLSDWIDSVARVAYVADLTQRDSDGALLSDRRSSDVAYDVAQGAIASADSRHELDVVAAACSYSDVDCGRRTSVVCAAIEEEESERPGAIKVAGVLYVQRVVRVCGEDVWDGNPHRTLCPSPAFAVAAARRLNVPCYIAR